MQEAKSKTTQSSDKTGGFEKTHSGSNRSDSDCRSSDEDLQMDEQLPEFVKLHQPGQQQELTFRLQSGEELDKPQLNDLCPLCAQKCSQPCCTSDLTALGCRFRAHYVCLLTLDTMRYNVRGYPLNLPKAALTLTKLQSRVSFGLNISHPLTNLTFVTLDRRLNVMQNEKGDRFVSCPLTRQNNSIQRGYEPNYVCFPLTDIRLELEMDLNLNEEPQIYDFVVVFDPSLKFGKKTSVKCTCGPVALELEVYLADYKPILSLMNYKYKYTDSPLVVLKELTIKLDSDSGSLQQSPTQQVSEPQPATDVPPPLPPLEFHFEQPHTPQFKDAVSPGYNMPMYGFNTDYNMYISQQHQLYQQQQQQQAYEYLSERSLSNGNQYPMYGYMPNMQNGMIDNYGVIRPQYVQYEGRDMNFGNNEIQFEVSSDKSGIYLCHESDAGECSPSNDVQPLTRKQVRDLIDSGQFKAHTSSNNGSRQLQKYLRRCSSEEVEEVLTGVYNDLHSFVVNDYANYMLQSLVSACNVDQRTRVLLKISENLVELCRNKQGTHCLQALIAKVTTSREFKLICSNIEHKFVELCEELNSSHFLLKIIGSFPIEELEALYLAMTSNFQRLAQNKTAVLVIKAFMTKVVGHDNMESLFVMLITESLETVIQDPYGNYVVQHAYEVYKQERCKPITSRMIQKLPQYSVQKFSSCVVEKCVGLYFNVNGLLMQDIQANILEVLSGNIEAIEEMLKFPLASLILQRLAKKNKTHVIVQNICKVLSLPRMSKHSAGWDSILYDHKEKSATCRNIKGESYSNFAQAVQHREKAREPKKGSRTPNLK